MGSSHGNFVKYPRTPHLFGSKGTDDDKHMGEEESESFIAHPSLIVEEKLDGTNVGIHFQDGEMILQCRGHLITEGIHPQYDLFKQWANAKQHLLRSILQEDLILFGEWLYAKHTVYYRKLTHFFYEFDIYDKKQEYFLDYQDRMTVLFGTEILTVPTLHQGALAKEELFDLIGPSCFASEFDNPITNCRDNLMEGLYLRIEEKGRVIGRAKCVRPEFVEKIKQSTHWQHQAIVPNLLEDGINLWGT